MAHVKCPGCALRFDRSKVECIHYKNRYWHIDCYNLMINKIAADEKDLKELEEYIKKLFKIEYVSARIRKQIKDMKESYNFTYSGIQKSLIYFYEVRQNSLDKANGGIGIVPYVYEDAKKYFYTIYMAQTQNISKNIESFVKKGREIKISPPQRVVKSKKLVDLDKLSEEVIKDGE